MLQSLVSDVDYRKNRRISRLKEIEEFEVRLPCLLFY